MSPVEELGNEFIVEFQFSQMYIIVDLSISEARTEKEMVQMSVSREVVR